MINRVVIALSLLLGSCTTLSGIYLDGAEIVKSSYLITNGETTRTSNWALARQTHFYLARNNELSELNSLNSDVLTDLLAQGIRSSFRRPTIGMLPESLTQALASADKFVTDFLIFPSVIAWDDRASTWTESLEALRASSNAESRSAFGLDRVGLQLIIMHAASGEVVDIVRLESSSGVLTLYEDSPDKVVLPLIKSFFADLVAASG